MVYHIRMADPWFITLECLIHGSSHENGYRSMVHHIRMAVDPWFITLESEWL